ncbi:hypothetical protein [Vibrio splendidus]|uniref:hypothetical protein n=1 Tax=Vibrio splendidus TaxID=29497 RepID=UPI00148DDAC2|nr:hypothetical protein [Vibrio splendidus]
MSVFNAAIVPRLETQPVISAMINASRNAITSFSIEPRRIQIAIAQWRACLAYRLQLHLRQTSKDWGCSAVHRTLARRMARNWDERQNERQEGLHN